MGRLRGYVPGQYRQKKYSRVGYVPGDLHYYNTTDTPNPEGD
jgi:hypothetical protein